MINNIWLHVYAVMNIVVLGAFLAILEADILFCVIAFFTGTGNADISGIGLRTSCYM